MDRLTWSAIQRGYTPEPAEHLSRAQSLGLNCPLEVFQDLFRDHHDNHDLADIHLRFVDWRAVAWEEAALSGVALRQIGVPRDYQLAVDEARTRTAQLGFSDDRPEVFQHWEAYGTWIRPPIVIEGDLLQSGIRYELLVGFTRLGNLLGALDRQDLSESALHRVWLGRAG